MRRGGAGAAAAWSGRVERKCIEKSMEPETKPDNSGN